EKTYNVGLIGRAASIFRVEEVIIYPDVLEKIQEVDANFIFSVLKYMEAPPYLRKYLIKIDPRLEYVGILPPLRTPHHPNSKNAKAVKEGELRDGIVVKTKKEKSFAYMGLNKLAIVDKKLPIGKRFTMRVDRVGEFIEASIVPKTSIEAYWGYDVKKSIDPLGKTIKSSDYDLVIGTSRYGRKVKEIVHDLKRAWLNSKRVAVLFGSPHKGIIEILKEEGLRAEDITDFLVNTVESQGVETIRTEEAIYISLAIFNTLNGF
ncbi:MAG: putative RNA uridine N3 methyltransferase, partial [Candidatus Bathyarchaeia archaeon]